MERNEVAVLCVLSDPLVRYRNYSDHAAWEHINNLLNASLMI